MNHFNVQNNFLTLNPFTGHTEEIIESINKYIDKNECKNMCVDISSLNLIDATTISAICSTKHFSKYPFGSLQWVVKNKETYSMLKPLMLKTVKTTVKRPIILDFTIQQKPKVVAIR